jgi:transposase
VEELLRRGHTVHVEYEACGFGFGLYRQLIAAGAHCYVIGPRKLDEECSRVKTDPRDATTLCQRQSRYLEGNTRELAVIRVPGARRRSKRVMFHGNALSWCVTVKSSKRKDAHF